MSPSEQMMCQVKAFSYTYEAREGLLFMDDDSRCDMRGCIAFFENIDPNVRIISTLAGDRMDTVYVREETGWKAKSPGMRPGVTVH